MKAITTRILQEVFERILLKLKQEGVTEIAIKDDYYRMIPADEWTNFDKDIIVVGSISDDIDSLNRVLNDPDRILTYVDFDRTASVLRAISEALNPVNGEG